MQTVIKPTWNKGPPAGCRLDELRRRAERDAGLLGEEREAQPPKGKLAAQRMVLEVRPDGTRVTHANMLRAAEALGKSHPLIFYAMRTGMRVKGSRVGRACVPVEQWPPARDPNPAPGRPAEPVVVTDDRGGRVEFDSANEAARRLGVCGPRLRTAIRDGGRVAGVRVGWADVPPEQWPPPARRHGPVRTVEEALALVAAA